MKKYSILSYCAHCENPPFSDQECSQMIQLNKAIADYEFASNEIRGSFPSVSKALRLSSRMDDLSCLELFVFISVLFQCFRDAHYMISLFRYQKTLFLQKKKHLACRRCGILLHEKLKKYRCRCGMSHGVIVPGSSLCLDCFNSQK